MHTFCDFGKCYMLHLQLFWIPVCNAYDWWGQRLLYYIILSLSCIFMMLGGIFGFIVLYNCWTTEQRESIFFRPAGICSVNRESVFTVAVLQRLKKEIWSWPAQGSFCNCFITKERHGYHSLYNKCPILVDCKAGLGSILNASLVAFVLFF